MLHIFGCKILLWSFGTLANFGNEQQDYVLQYRPNEVQKLDIFGNKVFVHNNDTLCSKLCCTHTDIECSHSSPVASRVKKVWRRELAIFGKTSKNFGKERLWVLNGSNLPPNSSKVEDYQRQNSPKSAKVARKLRSMAKVARKRESCAKVALRNIAIFWWDYLHCYLIQKLLALAFLNVQNVYLGFFVL